MSKNTALTYSMPHINTVVIKMHFGCDNTLWFGAENLFLVNVL